MIPEERLSAVAHALRAAFGTTECDDVRPLSGGLSPALVFRIVVGGRPYLIRLIPRTGALGDPTREFACLTAAADAGIAPRIWYANVEDRVLITDFVERQPFPDKLATLIAPTLGTLHSLQGFSPPCAGNYLDVADGFVGRFRAARLLPEGRTEELFRRYAAVTKVYPRNDDLVASHNDLKPENIVFDGDRVWLVDWEAAFLNDRYVDLAVVANFFVTDDAQEEPYLSAYFGEPASDYRRSRFYLMRQTIHVFYTTCFMLLAARAGTRIDPDVNAPDFRDIHRRLLSGEASVVPGETKVDYALAHMDQALREMRSPRFEEALACVAAFHCA